MYVCLSLFMYVYLCVFHLVFFYSICCLLSEFTFFFNICQTHGRRGAYCRSVYPVLYCQYDNSAPVRTPAFHYLSWRCKITARTQTDTSVECRYWRGITLFFIFSHSFFFLLLFYTRAADVGGLSLHLSSLFVNLYLSFLLLFAL